MVLTIILFSTSVLFHVFYNISKQWQLFIQFVGWVKLFGTLEGWPYRVAWPWGMRLWISNSELPLTSPSNTTQTLFFHLHSQIISIQTCLTTCCPCMNCCILFYYIGKVLSTDFANFVKTVLLLQGSTDWYAYTAIFLYHIVKHWTFTSRTKPWVSHIQGKCATSVSKEGISLAGK